jgi:hypothetical protein
MRRGLKGRDNAVSAEAMCTGSTRSWFYERHSEKDMNGADGKSEWYGN